MRAVRHPRALALAIPGVLVAAVSGLAPADAAVPANVVSAAFQCRSVPVMRPDINPSSDLASVAATSPCNAWAVGQNLSSRGFGGLIEHWNGRGWSEVPSANANVSTTHENELAAVAATSFGNAWAAGSIAVFASRTAGPRYFTLIEHWNGQRWSRMLSPSPAKGTSSVDVLTAIVAISRSDVWAAGSMQANRRPPATLFEHWNGQSWATVPSPTPPESANVGIAGLAAISAHDIWAVGSYEPTGPGLPYQYRLLVEHWDGSSWSLVPVTDPGGHQRGSVSRFSSVTAIAANDEWAAGSYTRPGGQPRTLIDHWDGSTWTQVPSVNPAGRHGELQLSGIAAVSARNIWAVGDYGSRPPGAGGHGKTLIEHWNGTTWSRVSSPSKPETGSYSLLRGVTALPGGPVLAVGQWSCKSASEPIAARHTSSGWRLSPTPDDDINLCSA